MSRPEMAVHNTSFTGLDNSVGQILDAGLVGFELGIPVLDTGAELAHLVINRPRNEVLDEDKLRFPVTVDRTGSLVSFTVGAPDGHCIGLPFSIGKEDGFADSHDEHWRHMATQRQQFAALVGSVSRTSNFGFHEFTLGGRGAGSLELTSLQIPEVNGARIMVGAMFNALGKKLQDRSIGNPKVVALTPQ